MKDMSILNPEGTSRGVRVLLVDDQRMVGEAVRRMVQGEEGIEFKYCQNPEEAVAVAEEFRPTVILQDLVMPGIDGLSLVEIYKTNDILKHVPAIVLSSQEDPLIKAESFARGANDYLVKLPDRIELVARIRHHSEGYIHLLERNAAFHALAESQRILAAELAEAADYVRSLLPAPLDGKVDIRWDFESCSSVGGDSFGYRWIDEDNLIIYVLDVCGHGVGAALLSVSVMNALSGNTLGEADFRHPGEVLRRLNEVFEMERHNNMYFTMWFGVYDRQSQQLRYASAGHPPALLFKDGQTDPLRLATPALPVGTMPGLAFKEGEVHIDADDRLYVYSDGVYEVRYDDGHEMTLDEFIPLLSKPLDTGVDGLRSIRETVAKIQNSEIFEDDFSLVEIRFPVCL
jgi:phosphoserine phosphatase RsbU/P